MESIQVEKATKDRLIRLGGAGTVDETIRCLLEQSNRLDSDKFSELERKIEMLIDTLKLRQKVSTHVIRMAECKFAIGILKQEVLPELRKLKEPPRKPVIMIEDVKVIDDDVIESMMGRDNKGDKVCTKEK